MKFFDSHSHIHDAKFETDREEMLARAKEAGVERILTLGDTLRASRSAIDLALTHPGLVIAAAGIHPSNANSWEPETAQELEQLLSHECVAVLGEIGLDYYWKNDEETVRKQQEAFREQLRMARRLSYPVSIHSRESNADVLRILEEENAGEAGGVLHCFIGSAEEMQRGVELGFYIGVGGIATYPKLDALRAAIETIPLDRLLIETDSPYLSPQPKRGRRNEPAYVAMTAEILAEHLEIHPERLAEITWENACRAFRVEQ